MVIGNRLTVVAPPPARYPNAEAGPPPVSKKQDNWELRRIKKWYNRIAEGWRPTPQELQIRFGAYADQAELLMRRIQDRQPWEDFVEGIDGAPVGLRRRLNV